MATSWGYYDSDSDDEFANEENKSFGGTKTALLVVIDATPQMFEEWKEGEDVPFRAAIKCCQSIWRSKVVSNDKDVVSLILMGSEQSKNAMNFENIYQLQELSTVKVAMIEELNKMKDSPDYDEFQSKVGSSDKVDLKNLFWLSKVIFDEGNANSYQKKIMYFTCNDSPNHGKPNLQTEAVKKFKDMGKVELTIVAFNDEFSLSNFYSRIVEDESHVIKADNLEGLLKVVRVKQRMRRPISRTTLDIGDGVKIGVGFYSLVRPAKKPVQVQINKRTTEEIHKTVNEFRAETGMPVLKSEERKMVQIQGEMAIFTKEEIKQAKQVEERGVQLLCFLNGNVFGNKPITENEGGSGSSDLSAFNHFVWYRSPGYFLYPDEERITGSRDLFIALLKRCYTLNKIAVVKMVLTRGGSPKLACLIPCLESKNAMFPQGFHVFPLPFADEIRQLDFEFKNPTSPNLVSLMEQVIKKLTNKGFDVLDVYNPALQHQWRELERIALDLPEPAEGDEDEFSDLTEPNEDLMKIRLKDLPQQIEDDEALKGCFSEQKSTLSAIGPRVDMAMEAKNKRLDKLTIPTLKGFLDSRKVNTYKLRRKAELVDAVYDYFKTHTS